MQFQEMSDIQRRVFIDTGQIYEAYTDSVRKSAAYRGGMHWKKAKGREYLFRSIDREGHGKSLGPRSPDTEKILADFRRNKERLKERTASLKDRLMEQSRFCKAARIQRVPRIVAGILRLLDQSNLLGKNVMVAGTNAIWAYEAAAGVFLDSGLLSTGDMDLLWDVRTRLTLAVDADTSRSGLLGVLQKADRSFEIARSHGFRAVNKNGYMVDLIKAEPKSMFHREPKRMGENGDMEAVEIRNLQWLLSSPNFSHIVIGHDGFPAAMVAPDPRAFALHKIWLADQPDREPLKKQRDRHQGVAVAQMVMRHLPQYSFEASELRMFPKEVVKSAKDRISDSESPAGFDF